MLNIVVSEHMYDLHQDKNEGFFSSRKAKIVSGKNLNQIGKKLIPLDLINHKLNKVSDNIYGNIVEAIIGAVYLDQGYKTTKTFIRKHILEPNVLFVEKTNYKSKVLEWSQKNKRKIQFVKQKQEGPDHNKKHLINLFIDGKKIAESWGRTIKSAEQSSAKMAYKIISPKST